MTSERSACLHAVCTLPRITVRRDDEEVKVIYENNISRCVFFWFVLGFQSGQAGRGEELGEEVNG